MSTPAATFAPEKPPSGAESRLRHILVVTGAYAPDPTGIAAINRELCEYLVSCGHQVSVVTGLPHYPEWKVPAEYRGRLWVQERLGGVTVHRGYIYVPGKKTTLRRIAYDTSIGISTALRGLAIHNVDLVLAVSPPLQAGLAGSLLARLHRVPFLVEIQDLLPDLAIALGMLRNPWAIRVARRLESYLYRRADALLVIGEGFRANLLAKGVPASKIFLTPNWVDTRAIHPCISSKRFRKAHGLGDSDCLVLHTGNMGAKQKLENVIEAAALLRDEPHIRFCLVGDGAEKDRLERFAAAKGLTNLLFLPLQPKETLPEMLSAADVFLLNQSAQIADMVIPSKLLTYMAAGRAVVAAVASASAAAQCIRESGGGLIVSPEDPAALAQAIRRLQADRQLAARLGIKGRACAERQFDRERLLAGFEGLLASFPARRHADAGPCQASRSVPIQE